MKLVIDISTVPVIDEKAMSFRDERRRFTLARDFLDSTMVVDKDFSSAKLAESCDAEAASVISIISPVEETCCIVKVIVVMLIFSSVSFITNCCLITTTSESKDIWSLLTVELAFCSMIRMALDGAQVTSA